MEQMDLTEIGRVVGAECARQRVNLAAMRRLLQAYEHLYLSRGNIFVGGSMQTASEILELYGAVEPKTRGETRRTPVTFQNGGTSCPPREVSTAFYRMVKSMPTPGSPEDEVDSWLKHLLWVHPCIDGNGRVAWLLYNYLGMNMHCPLPLPDYFSEEIV